MDAKEAFEQFKAAYDQIRSGPGVKRDAEMMKEVSRLLGVAIEAAGRRIDEVWSQSGIVDRTSVQRWLRGDNMPQPAQVLLLKRFLVPSTADHRSLAISLLDARYRPVISLLLEEEAAGRNMNEEQLIQALDLVLTSKRTLTPAILRIFLGIEE